MTALTEVLHPGGFLVSEFDDGNLSRDNKTLITGQNLKAGAVLGIISLGALTSAAKSGGNTGNGTCVPDATTPLLANAQAGIYQVRCIAAGANTATFRLSDPKGNDLGIDQLFNGSGASLTFANQIKFAITDGAVDFAVGDGFDLTVAAGSGKVTALAPAALDGSQYAAGLLYAATDATSADKPVVVITRLAEINSAEVVWPGSITGPQQAAATAQLTALGLVLR